MNKPTIWIIALSTIALCCIIGYGLAKKYTPVNMEAYNVTYTKATRLLWHIPSEDHRYRYIKWSGGIIKVDDLKPDVVLVKRNGSDKWEKTDWNTLGTTTNKLMRK